MSREEESDKPEEAPEEEADGVPEEAPEAEAPEREAGEEEFDLQAQIAEFRRQIEAEPENCIHYYNLGEALAEAGDLAGARAEFDKALERDREGDFSAIIHFGYGEVLTRELHQGLSSHVVKSSVGLYSSHRDKVTITEVHDADYEAPLKHYEAAIRDIGRLKADEEIVAHIGKSVPGVMASIYYKWASDLLDKARQLQEYGSEIQDVQRGLRFLKKTLEIDPGHSAANLLVKVAKQMLAEGWQSYDEYGFLAKEIKGQG